MLISDLCWVMLSCYDWSSYQNKRLSHSISLPDRQTHMKTLPSLVPGRKNSPKWVEDTVVLFWFEWFIQTHVPAAPPTSKPRLGLTCVRVASLDVTTKQNQVTFRVVFKLAAGKLNGITARTPVADPAFPRWGWGRQASRWGRKAIIWPKFPPNGLKMEEIWLGGGASLAPPPLSSANVFMWLY